MKSLADLLECLLLDCGRKSAAPVVRDVKTLRTRVKHEGDSFITITLPAFCRDFEKSLDLGRIAPGAFTSFRKKRSGIPAFLSGFLRNVFGSEGVLLPEPSIDCIRFVRQICLFGKKLLRPCTDARQKKAIEDYRKCDNEIVEYSGPMSRYFRLVARILCESYKFDDKRGLKAKLVPRHGPGATAEGILGNSKYKFRRWHTRLSSVGFTYLRFGLPRCAFDVDLIVPGPGGILDPDRMDQWRAVPLHPEDLPALVEPGDESPVRVVLVPKTLKTPRIIAVEPVCMQYAQQALAKYLVERLDHCSLTAGHINFDDQTVNQGLAKDASKGGYFATLDMSEASDRVSLAHVSDLLSASPEFLEWVLACRSTRARTPDGVEIPLKKFASMGSALCFPIESMVFFTIIVASRIRRAGLFPTAHLVHSFGRDVYVYGDDLIVPADEAAAICDDLESLGLKVNRNKSFWTGKFRESCGVDCYDSEEVTPVYLRRDLPTNRKDSTGIVSTVATCNQLWSAGYIVTATALRKAVEKVLGRLPKVPVDGPAVGWHFSSEVMPPRRSNRALQRSEDLCYVPVTPRVTDPLDGFPALAKCVRKVMGIPHDHSAPIPGVDAEHLESSPRRYGLTLKRRWVPALPPH